MPKTASCSQWNVSSCPGVYPFPEEKPNTPGTFHWLTAQMVKAMRLMMFFLFAVSLTVSARSSSQNITLSGKELPLKKVFAAIEAQTDYVFFYNKQLLADTRPVTVSVADMPLSEFLSKTLKDQPIHFRFEGKTITISRKPSERLPAMPPEVYEAPPADSGKKVSGIVLNESGEPVAGASVLLKGARRGVNTGSRGEFTMEALPGQSLVISFVGYDDYEVKVKLNDKLLVKLTPTAAAMKDMVVTGIYQRKKESFTGSSTTYTSSELKLVGNQNVLQSLKTLDPAFAIVENSIYGSDPNRMPDIEIRGKSSVIGLTEQYGTNPNQPLFILDGFESTLSIISDFTMDRIENITVLKDAAATAIYGSKAANGVIVVETKRPTPGRLRLNYNLNSSVNFADLSDYNLMNAKEKIEFERRSGFFGSLDANGNIITDGGDAKYQNRLKEVQRGVDTYWPNEPLRTGIAQRHTLFAEGGDATLRYSASLSLGKTPGIMKGSSRDVTNGNVRLIYRKGRLSVSNSLSLDFVNASRETVPFSAFSRANPYLRKYNATGGIDKVLESFQYSDASLNVITVTNYNPLYDMNNNNVNKTASTGFTNNFEIEWRLIDELRARARVGVNGLAIRNTAFRSPFNSEYADIDPLLRGNYTESNDRQTNYDGDFSLTYGKLFNGRHMVNAVAGTRMNQVATTLTGYEVRGFVDDEFSNPAFAFGYPEGKTASYQEAKRRSASFFLNTGYAYDNRYLLDATFRSDGASVFGASRQFTSIWSLGLAWNVHKEAFFKGADWVSSFRIRGSVGNPGNQNFSDNISTRVYRYNNDNRNPFGSSVVVGTFGNSALKWQKTIDKNIGVDLQLFKDRLRLNVDYFNKNTDPLLVFVTMPSSAGTTSFAQNLGAQTTKGFTVTANYALMRTRSLNWLLNLNMRQLKSRYHNMGNSLANFNKQNKSRNLIRYYDGASPSDLWAVRSLGIDAATGREVFLNSNDKQTFVHDYNDERVVGNSEPDLDGIVGTTVSYKGFTASVNLRYRLGGQVFMQTLYEKVENISSANVSLNQDKRALYDRWQKPGDNAKFKSIYNTTSSPISSRFVEDNNVLAGEAISVGYETSTARWLKSIHASSVTVRAYMNDIFRLSTVTNERGIDYPFARSVSFSVGVRF